MSTKTAKLQILSVENFSQQFGSTEYAVFISETEDKQIIPVAVSHNALRSRGVNTDLLDFLEGSTIVANDEVNISTGVFSTGKDRVQSVIDGTYGILLLNKANCSLIKSELYTEHVKDLASTTQAKLQVEERKERKFNSAKRIAERRKAKLESKSVAMLETNDEEGF